MQETPIVLAEGISATAQGEETLPRVQAEETLAIDLERAVEIVLEAGIFPAAIGAVMHSEEVGVDLMDRERVATVIAVQRAWAPVEEAAEEDSGAEEEAEAEEEVVAEAAEAGGDRQP